MKMASNNPLKEVVKSKTLFATLIIGILFSSFYIISQVFSASNSQWFSTSAASVMTVACEGFLVLFVFSFYYNAPNFGSEMPPLDTFRLTKELVQQRANNNIIVVTFGNFAFMDFVTTWVKHLSDIHVDNFLVGAMDTKLLEALYRKGIPVFDMGSGMSTIDVGWGSPKFHKMGRERLILIDSILHFGFELLICDTDMVWLKDPLPYLARFPEADILISTDQISTTVFDDGLDDWRQVGAQYNIGIILWRPTKSSMKLAKEWKDMLLADETTWDQRVFNELVRQKLGPPVDEDSRLVYAYDGNLKLGLLPASIFCSGNTYFVQAMYQQLKLKPYVMHTTFQYSGTEGKRHRLREAMVFNDPPEYFDVPGGFLTFKPNIPKSLLLEGEHNVETHFALVNYQIKLIRTALAIASLLSRTLVMPPLWCRLDLPTWIGLPRATVRSLTRQPFICPLDHVFQVNIMLKEFPEEEFGPGINFREYSLFDNPSMPLEVKDSWLYVHLCEEGSKGCEVSNSTMAGTKVVKFPNRSDEERLKSTFSTLKDVKVIEFSSMQDAFSGFSDKDREERFRKRVKSYTSAWCCVIGDGQSSGLIPYDMYWDEKPNWKPIPLPTP